MNTPTSAHTHYVTSFRVKSNAALREPLIFSIAKLLRHWVGEKERTTDGLLGKWFFGQGTWRNRTAPHTLLRVASEAGNRSVESPEFWGLHYRHADADPKSHRFWYSDACLRSVSDDEVLLGFRLSHAMQQDFIGTPPPIPYPSAPRCIDYLFRSPHWSVHSGGTLLERQPVSVVLGKGEALANSIFDPSRRFPIILVNGLYDSHEFPIKADELQRLLLGNAVVCFCDACPEVAEEIAYFLNDDYRCGFRMVRVYMPGANRANPGDYRRHRFFSSNTVRELTAPVVIEAIVNGLARNARLIEREALTSISDIEHSIRLRRLESIRSGGNPTPEWIDLLEKENTRLEGETKAASTLLEELEAERNRLEFDNVSLKDKLQSAKAKRAESAMISSDDRDSLAKILSLPYTKPRPIDCLRALAIIYPSRIRLLSSAIDSAEKAEGFRYVEQLWELLLKLSTKYYDAMSEGGAGDMVARKVFGKNEYSAKESETVESSPRLLRYRIFADDTKDRTMLRHLKIGVKDSKSETIRVHFDWEGEDKTIVIGYCGEHLPLS